MNKINWYYDGYFGEYVIVDRRCWYKIKYSTYRNKEELKNALIKMLDENCKEGK